VRNNQTIAEAPSIAGYIGAYTGLKDQIFTISYNVREIYEEGGPQTNLDFEIDGIHVPTQ
jgi:hypothetical protein